MKTTKLRTLFLSFLLVAAICSTILSVTERANASWNSTDQSVTIDAIGASGWKGGVMSSSSQIFWDSKYDRWYLVYAKFTGGSTTHQGYYAYSDAGDLTTWNNGGSCTGVLTANTAAGVSTGSHVAWAYNNETELGHLVWTEDHTSGGGWGVYYRNFTITGAGALTFGSTRNVAHYTAGAFFKGSIDICLMPDGDPAIGWSGFWISAVRTYAILADSNDGYSANWDFIYYLGYYRGGVSIIPVNNTAVVLLSAHGDTPNVLVAKTLVFGVTANSTLQGTTFSDLLVDQKDLNNQVYSSSFGVAYNSSHGMVHYTDASSHDGYAFLFDLDTMTRGTEYKTDDWGDGGVYRCWSTGGVFHNNEAFSTHWTGVTLPTWHYVRGNEYHNASYGGYWNYTNVGNIHNATMTSDSSYNGAPMTTARMTDDNGVNVIAFTDGTTLKVTWWTVSGEYPTIPPDTGEYETPTATETLYFRSDTWNVSDELGYKLQSVNSFANASVSLGLGAGDDNINVGVRVWRYDVYEEAYEITGGSPEALVLLESSTSGIEMFNGTFQCDDYLDVTDHLKVIVYVQANGAGYTPEIQFLTGSGDEDIKYYMDIENATCQVFYYLNFTSEDSVHIWFGDYDSNNARMLFEYERSDPWRTSAARMARQDFYGMVSTPWVYVLGNFTYAIFSLGIITFMVMKHGSYKMILLILWILGGSGSLLWAIIPQSGLVVAALMLALALAGSLFKLIHR